MKHLYKTVLLILLTLVAQPGQTKSLTESLLTTPDKKCAIRYWSRENTDGWYLMPIAGSCPNGVLEGPGRVTIRNREGHVIHSLDASFVQGYPIGSQMIPYPLLGAFNDKGNMTLTFDLGQDPASNIRFFGRLTVPDLADYPFSPDTLQPLRILMQADRESLFYSEESQRRLVAEAINRGKPISAATSKMYLFGAVKSNPDRQDILFFAEADLSLNQVRVKRRPQPRKNETDIPFPKEIRQEAGVPVVRILPSVLDRPAPLSHTAIPTDQPTPLIDLKGAPESVLTPSDDGDVNPQILPLTDESVPVRSDFSQPTVEAISSRPALSEDALDKIPHLLTSSRLLKQPVQGKALVHIARFNGAGQVIIDRPVSLSAKGNGLSLGWGVAEGYFLNTSDPHLPDTLGFIDITSFSPLEGEDPVP